MFQSMNVVRRIRGAIGIGVKWGVLWAAIGALTVVLIGLFRPGDIDAGEGPSRAAAVFALVGFLSGLGFAGLLSLAERRRTIHELSLARVALWGFLGAALIPILMGADRSMGFITGSLGALFAAASVATARREASAPRS
jgi:hypothetical protein